MRLLNNIREYVRKAGDRLRQMDNAYASRITDMYMGSAENPRSYAENPVLGTAAGLASIYGGGTPLSMRGSNEASGSAYVSAAARYGAPIAGVTLAGKGIYDLSQLGQEEEDDKLMISYVR